MLRMFRFFAVFLATGLSLSAHAQEYRLETWASGLEQPWSIAFLPNGDMLVTEKAGTLRLIRDGELVAAIEEERLSRIKNDGAFPLRAIAECLRIAGISMGEVDAVAHEGRQLVLADPGHAGLAARLQGQLRAGQQGHHAALALGVERARQRHRDVAELLRGDLVRGRGRVLLCHGRG